MVKILFVCMGNICRSPTAEGVMRALVRDAGLEHHIALDSAGTGGWHAGDPPDGRAVAAARARGVDLDGAARQVQVSDFDAFDLILAMDAANLADLRALAPDSARARRLGLLRDYDPEARDDAERDVPDPYYGGEDGFADVLDLVDAACRGLLAHLQASGQV